MRLTPLLLVSMLASAASADTLWLRGRGEEVWIEKDGVVQAPKKDRKGFTRIATPPRVVTPVEEARERWPGLLREPVVVLTEPSAYPPSYFHLYPAHRWHRPYVDYRPRHHRDHRSDRGFRSRHGHRRGHVGHHVQRVGGHRALGLGGGRGGGGHGRGR